MKIYDNFGKDKDYFYKQHYFAKKINVSAIFFYFDEKHLNLHRVLLVFIA